MPIYHQFQPTEASRANNVLQWLALTAPFDQLAETLEFRLRKFALEIQIELHARHLEQMRQQQFRLQPRRIHALVLQKFGAALDDFQNGHWQTVSVRADGQKRKLEA